MKIRVADYIAQLLIEHGIEHIFSVVGGGAMHLNDAFGNKEGLTCIYNHHEQACAIAAESYARNNNKMAAVCVTTGPGGTNAITGVLCAWQDSIPMLIISGQVRYDTTVESTGLDLRQFGEQEHNIIQTVKSITKYAVMIKDVASVRYEVEKAIWLAMHGRKGPCWIDIPLNIQGAFIEIDNESPFLPEIKTNCYLREEVQKAFRILYSAKKPVIVVGNGLRTSGAYQRFLSLKDNIGIPILAANGNPDLFPFGEKYYYGNFGMIGGRAGNFIIQNADCILVLGCRLSFKQIGFNYKEFSIHSKKIVIDIDKNELKKNTVNMDIPLCMDLNDFLQEWELFGFINDSLEKEWIKYCDELLQKFPIYLSKYKNSSYVNPYYFAEILKKSMPDDGITVVGNSCACDIVRQCGTRTRNQRLWGNTNCGTMGYDLPAAIGAAIAFDRMVACVTGDGSIQMNLQELQTIVHNQLPIKIFIHNNKGYFAITQTHTNFFGRLTGCTKETGISFPDFEKIAYAYNIPYIRCENHKQLEEKIELFIKQPSYGICEIISDKSQPIEPKMKSKVTQNGEIISPSIDDLYPFLEERLYHYYANFEHWKMGKELL